MLRSQQNESNFNARLFTEIALKWIQEPYSRTDSLVTVTLSILQRDGTMLGLRKTRFGWWLQNSRDTRGL